MAERARTQAGQDEVPTGDWLTELLDWLKYILLALLIGLLLVVFVIQRNAVIGNSMVPTLHQNDQLLVEKVTKWFGGIDYGDIITISAKDLPEHEDGPNIIKRVIGLPGDTIEIRDEQVYRNGEKLDESYLPSGMTTRVRNLLFEKVTLQDDEYFVMGDNRDVSLDSRSFGPVSKDHIIGTVLLRFYPFSTFGAP
ncbi:MAG: signal peptidase I [Clostridiaceae bacterium]|nr:signal peptidase I [Eubacteriales bacterium]MDD4140720.1 signal peptidase I [Eubacteriales bacterium]NLB44254.1 signal peptidase I [Clostridiaceae bacterium]